MSASVRVTPTPAEGVIEEIRVAMVRRRMSQRDLAKSIGEAEHWIHRRLAGKVDMSIGELFRIADALEINVRDLLPRRSVLPGGYSRDRASTFVAPRRSVRLSKLLTAA